MLAAGQVETAVKSCVAYFVQGADLRAALMPCIIPIKAWLLFQKSSDTSGKGCDPPMTQTFPLLP